MIHRIALIALLITCFGGTLPVKPTCGCKSAAPNATTRWGGNEWIAYRQTGVFKSIRGQVVMPLAELNNDILVEVFDQPDYLICEWQDRNPNNCTTTPPANQRRIAACATGKDGQFCFTNLPPGNYELRISKNGEWSPTHVYVSVDPTNRKSTAKPIEVTLKIGN